MSQGLALVAGTDTNACNTVDYLPEVFDINRVAEYGAFLVWYGLGQKHDGTPVCLMVWKPRPARAPIVQPKPFKFPAGLDSMRRALVQPCVQRWLQDTLQGDDRALLVGGGDRLLPTSPEENHRLVMNWVPYG